MGLTVKSTGLNAVDQDFSVKKECAEDRVIALAGNPNVGKSTIFNNLTGLNQHTGNWPGKTVTNAQGVHTYQGTNYILVDLPGTYSLMAHSAEEEIARDFLLFGEADAAIVVCDGTCLERNLNLVLQTIEIMPKTILCLNLMDEARKKNIRINLQILAEKLNIPVVATSARSGKGLNRLMEEVNSICDSPVQAKPLSITYPPAIEDCLSLLEAGLKKHLPETVSHRWLALRVLEQDKSVCAYLKTNFGLDIQANPNILAALQKTHTLLERHELDIEQIQDIVISTIIQAGEDIYAQTVSNIPALKPDRDRKLDKILTSKQTGIPIMLLLLGCIFWITISGANYPSQLLGKGLFWIQDRLSEFMLWIKAPQWLHGALVLGVYRVLAWVVSVMLPPMAIFFPLFTLLEDFGYLPRVAFNLDHRFKKAKACGKQALTMCMGFGCNCAGIVGCRIIDSPRERLIAILTNNFVPCNGRFPTLISIISMFFVGASLGMLNSLLSTVILVAVIVLGVGLTFFCSWLLSKTILKGEPSSFTLELPPYRTPQIGQVLIRSLLDRTLFVLGRAVTVAAPAGLVIWILANLHLGGLSLLDHCSGFLDPFARLLGLDGVILLAFILGFPANEIVIPIIIMIYLSGGTLMEFETLAELKGLLLANGWTWVTAISTMLFCLLHWPCSTACLTIKKETASFKWTLLAILIPSLTGIIICFLFTSTMGLLGFA